MDFLTQGIPLGRWFGTTVVVGFTHLIMLYIIASGAEAGGPIAVAMAALALFLSILLHEFGHATACKAVGGRADLIVLGPFGGLTQTQPPNRPLPQFITTFGGPLVNLLLLGTFWGLMRIPAYLDFVGGNSVAAQVALQFSFFMIVLNRMLLVLNLLPIFPMDGGRLLQQILWKPLGYERSIMVTGMIGTVGGGALIVLGIGLRSITIPYINYTFGEEGNPDIFLIYIGLLCAMQSFGLYQRALQAQNTRRN